jgi:hypothetical protein
MAEPDQQFATRAAGGLKPMAAEPMPLESGEYEVTPAIQATFRPSPAEDTLDTGPHHG